MENKHSGRPYDLIINGHKFHSANALITGKDILEIAELSPDDNFDILKRIAGKEFEPVNLTEKIDLANDGVERFEVIPVKVLTIEMDDETLPVPKPFMTPVEILALKGLKPDGYYLKQIQKHREINYKNDEGHLIAIICGMKFSTCKKGPTGVS